MPGYQDLVALLHRILDRSACFACRKGPSLWKIIPNVLLTSSHLKVTQAPLWFCMPLCNYRLSCRYHGILEEILQDVDITEQSPPALLEHIGCGPDQRGMFVSKPHPGTESIDLLMCAASMGSDSVLSALMRAGANVVLLSQSDLPSC